MENNDPEKNGLATSQNQLKEHLLKLNKLFKHHFGWTLVYFTLSLGVGIILIYAIFTDQIDTTFPDRYGLFGIIILIIQIIVIFILIGVIGAQVYFYGSFVKKENKIVKERLLVNSNKASSATKMYGIVPYVNTIVEFFNRYSKKSDEKQKNGERAKLSTLVGLFLFMNIIIAFFVFFLSTRLINAGHLESTLEPIFAIVFVGMTITLLMNLGTSIKLRKAFELWESIFPELDSWAENLENMPTNDTIFKE